MSSTPLPCDSLVVVRSRFLSGRCANIVPGVFAELICRILRAVASLSEQMVAFRLSKIAELTACSFDLNAVCRLPVNSPQVRIWLIFGWGVASVTAKSKPLPVDGLG